MTAVARGAGNKIRRQGAGMEKTSYIACPVEECRERLGNVGIGYRSVGTDVYRFNSVQKKGSGFSFYATVTLRPCGADGTDVTLVLNPDEESAEEPRDVNGDYNAFASRFFKALSQPAIDPFAEYGGNNGNSSYATGATKHCVRCGAVIDEKAVVCPKCGCSQRRDYMVDKTSAVGIAAIIFAALGGWLGIALSLFGLLFYYKGDTEADLKGKKNCKIALGIVIAWIAVIVVYYIVIFALMGT